MNNQITYICLQSRKEGTAGYAHVTEIIRGLQRRKWRVKLFEPSYSITGTEPSILERVFNFLWVQIRFIINSRSKPDLAYLRSHFALLPATLYCKLRGIPVIQEINGPFEDLFVAWPFTKRLAWIFNLLSKLQYRLSDAAIAVTPNLGEWFVKQAGTKPVYIIPNGANTDMFHPQANSTIDIPKPYVFFFGTLAKWQGIDTILAAAKHPNWPQGLTLAIAGDGVEQNKVAHFCSLYDHAIWLKKIPYEQIPGVIAGSLLGLCTKSDVQAHSKTGLFPLKLFETLACGIPIIVTDFPGQADLVREHACGLIIEPNDPESLVNAVIHIFTHPKESQKMGANGTKTIQQNHSWDSRAAETDKAIRSLIHPKVA
jgi:glycosyltransferase involved in cell wall biosynthesis